VDESNLQPDGSTDELTPERISELMTSSTLPANLSICLRGFEDKDQANVFGQSVGCFLKLFGTVLNLDRLEGVTVARDYDAALASIDSGTGTQTQSTATNDTFARGVAMAVRVLRQGQVKCHIVVAASLMTSLLDPVDAAHSLAVGLLAHEAAHVHDLHMQERAFPGVLLRPRAGYREHILLQIAHACWDEYAACRLSARFQHPEQLDWYQDTFCSFADGARDRADRQIHRYRRHGNVAQLVQEVLTEYGGLFKYAAYLLGHLDGLQLSLDGNAPKAAELINRRKNLGRNFNKLSTCLKSMWATYESWPGFQVFDSLCEFADDVLRQGGIEIEDRAEGAYVNVPFTSHYSNSFESEEN
jgi:hypothetical protein